MNVDLYSTGSESHLNSQKLLGRLEDHVAEAAAQHFS